ncbi:MAG: hypothetical protein ABW185_26885, partial [Sedimenticola sp.]
HNPTSTTANDSFHGTAISLTQHKPDPNVPHTICISDIARTSKSICELPEAYSNVQPVTQLPNNIELTVKQGCALPPNMCLEREMHRKLNG